MQFQNERGEPVNAFQSGIATVRLLSKDPPRYAAVDAANQPVRTASAVGLLGDLESGRINGTIQRFLTSQAACPF
jgi:hypothetical protein